MPPCFSFPSFTSHRRPWSELPTEILIQILPHLHSLDLLRFSLVCSSYRSACRLSPDFPSLSFPFLLIPRTPDWSLFTPKSLHSLPLPLPATSRCLGSSHGWLALTDHSRSYHLLNPLSLRRIPLPPPSARILAPGSNPQPFWRLRRLTKAVLSSPPAAATCSIVAKCDSNNLVHCRLGDRGWSLLSAQGFRDIAFRHGLLYCLTLSDELIVYDFAPDPKFKHSYVLEALKRYSEIEEAFLDFYLVATLRKVMVVVRRMVDGEDEYVDNVGEVEEDLTKTLGFDVFDLCEASRCLVEVRSLGEEALFLGDGCCKAFTVGGGEGGGYRGDSVYFTDSRLSMLPYEYEGARHDCDQGVFCLADRRIERLLPEGACSSKYPPFWFPSFA